MTGANNKFFIKQTERNASHQQNKGHHIIVCTGFFTSDNEPDEIENATHNTFAKLTWIFVF
jgi:hypothetical protein